MNPMTNHRPGYSIARAIIIMVCVAALLSLFGCSSNPVELSYETLAKEITVTKQEYIVLRTGQICEIKDMKIVACGRDPSLYAETVEEIKAIVGEE